VKVAEIPADEAALVRVSAMLLMIVFAVKAALFPVQFWLPGTYANAPAPVAALFAIMTKVGAYAIIRVHTIAFGPGVDATSDMAATWLFPAAVVTVAVGAFGVLGARRLLPLIAFSAVGSMGTLLLAVAAFSPQALTAALYYVVHSTFAAAALFLVADLVVTRRQSDTLSARPATVQNGLFASLFFAAAIAMAGMPPLSGFLGKLLVLDALRAPGVIGWAWGAILIGSLLTIVGFARAGSNIFWKSTATLPEPVAGADETAVLRALPARPAEVAPAMMLIALLALLAVFAGPVADYLEATAAQIFDRAGYVAAVLSPDGEV
jgi:multicomponent K+:H+ antiporter subunit D